MIPPHVPHLEHGPLPLMVIVSALMHLFAAYAVLKHPAFSSGPVFDPNLTVRFLELPAGTGGATEGEAGKAAEEAPPPEEEPQAGKPPKTTLPGPEKPKALENRSVVEGEKPGKALGLGHAGPAGLGGKNSGIILDQSTFEYAWYKARLEDTLKSHWQKPPPKSPKTTAASVHFVIAAAGEVRDVQLVQSSGDPVFDQTVLRAIYDSAPFPKFPPAYQEDSLGVLYTFELLPEK